MPGIGSVFGLPFKTPNWLGTFAVMGLITLIPIAGQMNLYGWVLTQLDYYRAGREDVPPAGLHYISRGVNIFIVTLVWALPIILVLGLGFVVFYGSIFAAAASCTGSSCRGSSGSAAGAAMGVSFTLFFVAIILVSIYGLLLQFLQPAIWIATERGGTRAGMSPRYVWALATHNTGNTLIAALLEYAARFLGSLGIYACYVGYIFTAPYGALVMAGILRHYEHALDNQQAAVPPSLPPAPAV
ncbi:MAG: hypothetical protein QOE92_860 [Chloroflexota bacterium]|jgi:hypothetical protein|nr:hypothetical protein [Chloroflexota bacterium]